MKKEFVKMTAWTVTAIAVIFGIYYTRSANCLWAFFFPFCLKGKSE